MSHKSAWLITLNSNSKDRKFIKPLKVVWEYLVSHLKNFMWSKSGGKLLNVRNKHAVEIGGELGLVHLHAKLIVETSGVGYLDYRAINEFFNRQLSQVEGFKRCHFDAKLVKNFNGSDIVERYVGKEGDRMVDPQKVPYTFEGFKRYCRVKYGEVEQYFTNQDDLYKDFIGVCRAIKEEIRENQIIGGLLGFYNPSITQRLNGLAEKQQTENLNRTTGSPFKWEEIEGNKED